MIIHIVCSLNFNYPLKNTIRIFFFSLHFLDWNKLHAPFCVSRVCTPASMYLCISSVRARARACVCSVCLVSMCGRVRKSIAIRTNYEKRKKTIWEFIDSTKDSDNNSKKKSKVNREKGDLKKKTIRMAIVIMIKHRTTPEACDKELKRDCIFLKFCNIRMGWFESFARQKTENTRLSEFFFFFRADFRFQNVNHRSRNARPRFPLSAGQFSIICDYHTCITITIIINIIDNIYYYYYYTPYVIETVSLFFPPFVFSSVTKPK